MLHAVHLLYVVGVWSITGQSVHYWSIRAITLCFTHGSVQIYPWCTCLLPVVHWYIQSILVPFRTDWSNNPAFPSWLLPVVSRLLPAVRRCTLVYSVQFGTIRHIRKLELIGYRRLLPDVQRWTGTLVGTYLTDWA